MSPPMDPTFKPIYDKSEFKDTGIGKFVLTGMFVETHTGEYGPFYSLNDDSKKGYPSLKRLYLDMEDLAEHKFAETYLHSYAHFAKLMEFEWFKDAVEVWRRELKLKIVSRAMKNIIEEAEGNTAQSFIANKYLISGEWEKALNGSPSRTTKDETLSPGRGRPPKSEIEKHAKAIAQREHKVNKDFERIFQSAVLTPEEVN